MQGRRLLVLGLFLILWKAIDGVPATDVTLLESFFDAVSKNIKEHWPSGSSSSASSSTSSLNSLDPTTSPSRKNLHQVASTHPDETKFTWPSFTTPTTDDSRNNIVSSSPRIMNYIRDHPDKQTNKRTSWKHSSPQLAKAPQAPKKTCPFLSDVAHAPFWQNPFMQRTLKGGGDPKNHSDFLFLKQYNEPPFASASKCLAALRFTWWDLFRAVFHASCRNAVRGLFPHMTWLGGKKSLALNDDLVELMRWWVDVQQVHDNDFEARLTPLLASLHNLHADYHDGICQDITLPVHQCWVDNVLPIVDRLLENSCCDAFQAEVTLKLNRPLTTSFLVQLVEHMHNLFCAQRQRPTLEKVAAPSTYLLRDQPNPLRMKRQTCSYAFTQSFLDAHFSIHLLRLWQLNQKNVCSAFEGHAFHGFLTVHTFPRAYDVCSQYLDAFFTFIKDIPWVQDLFTSDLFNPNRRLVIMDIPVFRDMLSTTQPLHVRLFKENLARLTPVSLVTGYSKRCSFKYQTTSVQEQLRKRYSRWWWKLFDDPAAET